MNIEPKIKARFSTVLALAAVMLVAQLLISAHVTAFLLIFGSPAEKGLIGIAIRYIWASFMIVFTAFAASATFCIHPKLAWWSSACCIAAMFALELNTQFTDYSLYGLIDALLFMLPRLLLAYLAMLAFVPIVAAGAAKAAMLLRSRFTCRPKCSTEL